MSRHPTLFLQRGYGLKKPETKIVNKIQAFVKSVGGVCVKVHGSPYQRAGDPDLRGAVPIFFKNGSWPVAEFVHFQVEVKLPGEEPDELQEERLRQWELYGYTVGVARSVDEFKVIIRKSHQLTSYAGDDEFITIFPGTTVWYYNPINQLESYVDYALVAPEVRL